MLAAAAAIKHAVLDYSDDCELLEIIMPADFETVELEYDEPRQHTGQAMNSQ